MIRPAKPEDADAMATIYNHYILNSIATFEEEPVTSAEMRSRLEKIESYGLPWLVVEAEGEVTGYAYAGKWHIRSAYKYTVEISVYTSHNAVAKGLGSQLYEALFNELRKLSIRNVIGMLATPNDASVALHEKFGMKKVAHLEKVGFKFDRLIDVGYWQGQL